MENLSLTEVKEECQRLLGKNRSLQKELRDLKKARDIPEGGDVETELHHAKEALLGVLSLIAMFHSF